jgi:hypothetical protein
MARNKQKYYPGARRESYLRNKDTAKQYYIKNKERIKAYNKAWIEKLSDEDKEKLRQYQRNYYITKTKPKMEDKKRGY